MNLKNKNKKISFSDLKIMKEKRIKPVIFSAKSGCGSCKNNCDKYN